MKHETYHLLKHAYLGHVDKSALLGAASQEKDPFLQRAVQLVTQNTPIRHVPWNTQTFTTEFRQGTARERLDQTVMTFFMRLVAIIKEEMHIRTFQKPESHAALYAWINMFKYSLFAVLSLLYKVRWEEKDYFELDKVVFESVHEGKASALRHFMERDLNIELSASTTVAEQVFETLNFLSIAQFGSSFWRLLHWMAEAMDLRDNDEMARAKQIWRELITGPLYRMLRCGICMAHMRKITQELGPQLLDSNTRYRQLWYNIHNKVTATKLETYHSLGFNLQPSTYSESELEQDAAFMLQALDP
ncbi:hypothetical protein AVEN_261794-1 [Araneus ventricosus]|uniref:Sulfhydryl oxidase n=1 Tax=Araneus ventricosus TaxID=182803 RepID=A0A4Y2LY27_ARAVE|nr:hypothetical protein AVEN_261794-1 [Araneus ventricosus]